MPVRPVEYHPFQYPRKYRPLGYGSWEPPPPPPPDPGAPPRRRRTVALILAALLATIVIHVGIAAAYDGGSTRPTVAQPGAGTPSTATCGQPQDPFNDPEFQDVGAGNDGPGSPTDEAISALRQRL
jgi:hypothetical protein